MRHFVSLFLASILVCLALSSCKTQDGQFESPVVGFAGFNGEGMVYTDGNVVVAWGACQGSAGILVKGVWMPGVVPFTANKDTVFVANLSLGVQNEVPRGSPMPLWAKSVLPPAVITAEGFTFNEYKGPGDVVPQAPIQKSAE